MDGVARTFGKDRAHFQEIALSSSLSEMQESYLTTPQLANSDTTKIRGPQREQERR